MARNPQVSGGQTVHVWSDHKEISLAPSACQSKHIVQQGQVCCYCVLDCGLGPRLITRTLKKGESTWIYDFDSWSRAATDFTFCQPVVLDLGQYEDQM